MSNTKDKPKNKPKDKPTTKQPSKLVCSNHAKIFKTGRDTLTDEELLMRGKGDEDFIPYATRFKTQPNLIQNDLKFLVRLAARHAHLEGKISPTDQAILLQFISNPVQLHRDGYPFDTWQRFENQVLNQIPKELQVENTSNLWRKKLDWLAENWAFVHKTVLAIRSEQV